MPPLGRVSSRAAFASRKVWGGDFGVLDAPEVLEPCMEVSFRLAEAATGGDGVLLRGREETAVSRPPSRDEFVEVDPGGCVLGPASGSTIVIGIRRRLGGTAVSGAGGEMSIGFL